MKNLIDYLQMENVKASSIHVYLKSTMSVDLFSTMKEMLLKNDVTEDLLLNFDGPIVDAKFIEPMSELLSGNVYSMRVGWNMGENEVARFIDVFQKILQGSVRRIEIRSDADCNLLSALIGALVMIGERCSLQFLRISGEILGESKFLFDELTEAVLRMRHLEYFEYGRFPNSEKVQWHLAHNRGRAGLASSVVNEFIGIWTHSLRRSEIGAIAGPLQSLWSYLDRKSILALASASKALHAAAHDLDGLIKQLLVTTQSQRSTQYDLGWIPAHISLGSLSDFGFAQLLRELRNHVRRALADAHLLPLQSAPADPVLAQSVSKLVAHVTQEEIDRDEAIVLALSGRQPGRQHFDTCVGWCIEKTAWG